MNWQLLWFVLAGLVLGFALSTLWEWFYFRRERMIVRDDRITELEAQLRAYEQREQEQRTAAPPWTAPGYQSPSALLESEQAEDFEPSVGIDDFVEASDSLASKSYLDDEADTVEQSEDEAVLAGAVIAAADVEGGEADEAAPEGEPADNAVAIDGADDHRSEIPVDDEEDSEISGEILPAVAVSGVGLGALAAASGSPEDEVEDEAADESVDDADGISGSDAQKPSADGMLAEDLSEGESTSEIEAGEELADDTVTADISSGALSATQTDDEEDSEISDVILPAAAVAGAGLAVVAVAKGRSEEETEDEGEDQAGDESVDVTVEVPAVASEEPSDGGSLSDGVPQVSDTVGGGSDKDLPGEPIAADTSEIVLSETPNDDQEDDAGISGAILPAAAVAGTGLAAVTMGKDRSDEDVEVEAADESADEESAAALLLRDESETEGLSGVEPVEDLPDDIVEPDSAEIVQVEDLDVEEEDSGSSDKILPAAAVAGVGLAAVAMAASGSDDETEEETAEEPVDDAGDVSLVAAEEASVDASLSEGGPDEEVPDDAFDDKSESVDRSEDSPDEPRTWKPEEIRGHPDNLSRVKGVGKVYRRRLYEAGIFTWHQLSQMSVEEITEIAHPFVSADVEEWPERARRVAERHGRVGAQYVGPAPDDLTAIRGIGANTMQRLYLGGIWSFSQLATSSPEDLKAIIPTSPSGENINYEVWIKLAAELAQEQD
jgi:predicted flap endonuclease-1-like 5' DNA nuclease